MNATPAAFALSSVAGCADLAALACGCLLAAAPGALARSNAAVVAEGGATVLRVESADPALAMSVRFQPAGALVRVRDGIGGVGAGAGCVQEGADAVCGPVSAIRATGTGLTDLLDNQSGFRSTLVGAGSPDAPWRHGRGRARRR